MQYQYLVISAIENEDLHQGRNEKHYQLDCNIKTWINPQQQLITRQNS